MNISILGKCHWSQAWLAVLSELQQLFQQMNLQQLYLKKLKCCHEGADQESVTKYRLDAKVLTHV